MIKVINCTTDNGDKPWVTPRFRTILKERQQAFMGRNLVRYNRLRNRTQRMAANLCKNYFAAEVEQLHSSDPHQWWTKTKGILKNAGF